MDLLQPLASEAFTQMKSSLTVATSFVATLLLIAISITVLVRTGFAVSPLVLRAFGIKYQNSTLGYDEGLVDSRIAGTSIMALLTMFASLVEGKKELDQDLVNPNWTAMRSVWLVVRVLLDAVFVAGMFGAAAKAYLMIFPSEPTVSTPEIRQESTKQE